MKKILLAVLALLVIVPFTAEARSYRTKSSDVYVKGYTTKNGTYVAPHYRSAPDNSILNNYGCIDNGKCGGSTTPTYTYTPVKPTVPIYTSPTPVPTYTYQPAPTCSDFSYWNGSQCACMNGYVKSTKSTACLSMNESCVELYGPSAAYREGDGLCHYCTTAGYTYDRASGMCLPPKQQTLTTTPSPTVKRTDGFVGISKSSNGHRVEYFRDGSVLDLDTMEIVK